MKKGRPQGVPHTNHRENPSRTWSKLPEDLAQKVVQTFDGLLEKAEKVEKVEKAVLFFRLFFIPAKDEINDFFPFSFSGVFFIPAKGPNPLRNERATDPRPF